MLYPSEPISNSTLCDGTPRAASSPVTIQTSWTSSDIEPTAKIASPTFRPDPCSPNYDDCNIYWYGKNLPEFTDEFTSDLLDGACGFPPEFPLQSVIEGGPVQLIYFPEERQDGAFCEFSNPALLYGPTPTIGQAPLKVITTLGTTFTSGYAYISFSTLYAAYRTLNEFGGSAVEVAPGFANTFMSFASSEISTNCFDPWPYTAAATGNGKQLNFADLNSPIPASAYHYQNQCVSFYFGTDYSRTKYTPYPCNTIFDNFNPLLAMPTRLRELAPEWKSCELSAASRRK